MVFFRYRFAAPFSGNAERTEFVVIYQSDPFSPASDPTEGAFSLLFGSRVKQKPADFESLRVYPT
jgi:hypothetical protein